MIDPKATEYADDLMRLISALVSLDDVRLRLIHAALENAYVSGVCDGMNRSIEIAKGESWTSTALVN
jgi:hypothetical protein